MLCCVDVGDDEDISWKYGWRWLVTTVTNMVFVVLVGGDSVGCINSVLFGDGGDRFQGGGW